MKHFTSFTFVTFIFTSILISCQGKISENKENTTMVEDMMAQYNIHHLFRQEESDSLMITIVTYMGKKAPLADHNTKFSAQFRSYYQELAQHFTLCYLYKKSDENLYYYYIIRPAKSPEGNHRGAGGSFRIRQDLKLHDFVEIFNTPVYPPDSLKLIGVNLFQEMINTGNVDQFLGDPTMIEWPDEKLRYDKERNEWRYDVQN